MYRLAEKTVGTFVGGLLQKVGNCEQYSQSGCDNNLLQPTESKQYKATSINAEKGKPSTSRR
jgi:hypothetical protein